MFFHVLVAVDGVLFGLQIGTQFGETGQMLGGLVITLSVTGLLSALRTREQ